MALTTPAPATGGLSSVPTSNVPATGAASTTPTPSFSGVSPVGGSSTLARANKRTTGSITTLPAWYDLAQQNVVQQAQNIQAPQLGQTVAQGAINTLSGPQNPFTLSTNTLNNIATGAANPFITDPNTGAVTPNVNTPMGALFAAQRDQLTSNIPSVIAPADASAIGSGQFGSLRGQTAADVAKAKAMNDLFAQQSAAALQGQQVGAQAAQAIGTVGAQGINTMMNVGQEQMTAPYANLANMANIIAGIKAPTKVSGASLPSSMDQYGGALALGSAVASGAGSILNSLGYGKTPTSNYTYGNYGSPSNLSLNSSTPYYSGTNYLSGGNNAGYLPSSNSFINSLGVGGGGGYSSALSGGDFSGGGGGGGVFSTYTGGY